MLKKPANYLLFFRITSNQFKLDIGLFIAIRYILYVDMYVNKWLDI